MSMHSSCRFSVSANKTPQGFNLGDPIGRCLKFVLLFWKVSRKWACHCCALDVMRELKLRCCSVVLQQLLLKVREDLHEAAAWNVTFSGFLCVCFFFFLLNPLWFKLILFLVGICAWAQHSPQRGALAFTHTESWPSARGSPGCVCGEQGTDESK